ncbi:endolytic transglycosylase MltG [Paenibacillus lutrae]|uniref:Endolytic murein transglycosylase n=1 Tax=Paenibacillus lutrae TaxID=2078573 RepID=A0A7X3FH01_9BACL|nr:endolytic transglycosylase MltG [Paenibacillus lutrae]MVO99610.1 endolytic transglycosylase MltG [Paenibacillus lutrae]
MERPKSRLKRVFAVLLILILLLAGGAAAAYYIKGELQPVEASEQEKVFEVVPGDGIQNISAKLQQEGLIRNASIFSYYVKWKKEGGRFQAGEYSVKPGMKPDEMIALLNSGQPSKSNRLTIPEGFTIPQIADKVDEQLKLDSEAFLKAAEGYKPGSGGEILASIPADAQLKHRLEGYLFPDTYEVPKDATEAKLVDMMIGQLQTRVDSLPADWQDKLKQSGLTFHQMMTVASLIEREVVLEEERPIVASVIYNRLKIKQPLQIDATVQYALGKQKERLFESDLKIESPYNTYKNPGLPPGPIASPSLSSIKAALYPAESSYFYYVTKKDGSKGHLFGETYKKHLENIEKSKQTEKNAK